MTTKVNWVLDADIRKFYDTLDQGWSEKFVEYGIADRSVVRLIQRWLKAGVLLLKHYRDGVADVDHLDLQAHDFETAR